MKEGFGDLNRSFEKDKLQQITENKGRAKNKHEGITTQSKRLTSSYSEVERRIFG